MNILHDSPPLLFEKNRKIWYLAPFTASNKKTTYYHFSLFPFFIAFSTIYWKQQHWTGFIRSYSNGIFLLKTCDLRLGYVVFEGDQCSRFGEYIIYISDDTRYICSSILNVIYLTYLSLFLWFNTGKVFSWCSKFGVKTELHVLCKGQ